jgi:ribonuclease HII
MKSLYPEYEFELFNKGYDAVIGIDEAGRGPWAGPVSIAAYIFSMDSKILNGVNDSKKLSRQKRESIFNEIETTDLSHSSGKQNYLCELISSTEIDSIGVGIVIERSIQSLMDQIIEAMANKNLIFLIDGYFKKKFNAEFKLVKGGDAKHYSIGAASIIAKHKRDLMMYEFASLYPEYGFDKHVGYGTVLHRMALEKYGTCPIHRYSYKPVAKIAKQSKSN